MVINLKAIINFFIKNKKDQIMIKNIVAAFIIKGGGLCISFFSMPAFINYFNNQAVLGVWFAILSVMTWILNFDFGIGNGLRNHLVQTFTRKNILESKILISSAYIIIGTLVIICIYIGMLIIPYVNWNHFFNISTNIVDSTVMIQVIKYIYIGIMLQFFFRLISSILYALQQSAVNNFLLLLISLMQLFYILFFYNYASTEEKLINLSLVYIFFTNIPYLLVTAFVFFFQLKECRPNICYFRINACKKIINLGGIFFLCQLLYMVIINANDFFVTRFTNPVMNVEYNVYNRLFSLVGMIAALSLTPLWSMVTKAIEEKDYEWLKNVFNKSKKITVVITVIQFLFIFILQFIINIWLGKKFITVNYFYAFIFAIWASVFVYLSILSTFACGSGKMKLQAICYTIGVIVKILFLLLVFNFTNEWIFVVISNLIIILPYCILQHKALNKYISKMEGVIK